MERTHTTDLPALPIELLLEIIAYLPQSLPVPCETFRTVYAKEYLVRRQTLQSLSQTCQRFRQAILPILWDRIEACASVKVETDLDEDEQKEYGISLPNKWREDLGIELLRQLEIVTVYNPALAQHIRTVSAVLTNHGTRTILKKLVRALAQFPNLDTIQFLGAGKGVQRWMVDLAFKDRTFPSVRTLVLTSHARWVMSRFPNTTLLVSIPDPWPHEKTVTHATLHLKSLQEFRGITGANFGSFMYSNFYDVLAESFPLLQVLHFDTNNTSITLAMINTISAHPNLRKVIFMVNQLPSKSSGYALQNTLVEEGIVALKKVAPIRGVKRQIVLQDPFGVQYVYFETEDVT